MCLSLHRLTGPLFFVALSSCVIAGKEASNAAASILPIQSGQSQPSTGPDRATQGVGQLLVEDAQSGVKYRLNLARYHVHVVLQAPVALVQIDQSFYNPFDRQQEGTFVFNLPRSASVSRFAMYVTRTQLVEGELIERKRASNIYESIVRSMRDPAILEQIGDNLFKMRVFPIFARDTKRILLDYTVPLVAEQGCYRFALPLMSDLEPIWDFRVSGVIHGPTDFDSIAITTEPAINAACETRPDGTASFEVAHRSYKPKSDLSIQFKQHSEQPVTVRSYAPEPVVQRAARVRPAYFLATLWPGSVPGTERVARPDPADVLILAETSSDIHDRQRVRRSVQSIVTHLAPDDRFQLGCLDVTYRPVCDGWLTPGSAEAKSAMSQFGDQLFLGATDLASNIVQATSRFGSTEPGRRRIIVYVGACAATYGEQRTAHVEREIAEQLRRIGAAFFAVLVDDQPQGRRLAESLAGTTAGRVFDAGPVDREEHQQGDLSAWLAGGLATPVKVVSVQAEGAEDLAFDPSWVPGRTFDLLGRVQRPGDIELEIITETTGTKSHNRWKITVSGTGQDVFVGRHWAQRRLMDLRAREQDGDADARDQIVALSQEWSLLSPHTAFLVLENERDYLRYGIERAQRHRYWRPADSMPEAPLPDAIVKAPARPLRQVSPEAFEQAVINARTALDAGDAARALAALRDVQASPLAVTSPEYTSLEHRARAVIRQNQFLKDLGPHRRLLERDGRAQPDGLKPSVMPLLYAGLTPSFLNDNPHAPQLLREAKAAPHSMSLEQFTQWVAEQTGLNVMMYLPALDERWITKDMPLDLRGIRRMSLRNVLSHVLEPAGLTVVSEPSRLLVTTQDNARERLAARVYPVSDIIQPGRVPELNLLAHPYLDFDRSAESRIANKLTRPVSIDFHETPLRAVVEHFQELLDDNVLIDVPSLEKEGQDPEKSWITAKWRDVSAAESLRWILEPLGLDYTVLGEAIRITSRLEADNTLTTRVYSGLGIIHQHPVERWEAQNVWWGRGGLGGFGGAMGGGMGGGGGFGGGMGGAGGFAGGGMGGSIGSAPAGVGISDDDRGQEPTNSLPVPDRAPIQPDPSLEDVPVATNEDDTIDLVTSTIAQNSWSRVGGSGTIEFWPPTLDFIVLQTQRNHRDLSNVLHSLRALPSAAAGTGAVVATVPAAGPGNSRSWDTETLIQIVEQAIEPNGWSAVGGASSIQFDIPRLTMVVSTPEHTHELLTELLTDLRRSRYAALRGDRPWESFRSNLGHAVFAGPSVTQLPSEALLAKLPEPTLSELNALAVRRNPADESKWRHVRVAQQAADEITIRHQDQRAGIDFGHAAARIEGDKAAIAYPGLALVEHGPWGEAARQLADARLPWLPHRTNEELARLFQIRTLHEDTTSVRLQLNFPEASGREAMLHSSKPQDRARKEHSVENAASTTRIEGRSYVEAVFSKEHGLPVAWDAYLNGELKLRVRFAGLDEQADPPTWNSVMLEDAAGTVLERWERTGVDRSARQIPALGDGWDDYVQLGKAGVSSEADPRVDRVLESIRQRDWARATHELEDALMRRPKQPLLLFLQAWCHGQDSSMGTKQQSIDSLKVVAGSGANCLLRAIADGSLPFLTAAERLEILGQEPAALRTAEDWDRLAAAAIVAQDLHQALCHSEAALQISKNDGFNFDRRKRHVELLLRLGRDRMANDLARSMATHPDITLEQLTLLADVLVQFGQKTLANEVLSQAACNPAISPDRYFEITQRRIALHEGLPRWRLLLGALDRLPAGSLLWNTGTNLLLAELSEPAHAEIAGQLASNLPHGLLWANLRIRQAELTRDPMEAAAICWELYEAKYLRDKDLDWACSRLCDAARYDRVIRILEARLRVVPSLSRALLDELAMAYEATDQPSDALRALSGRRAAR